MKQIRTLAVSFDTYIAPYEVPAFRGAVIEKAGRENILFHNHISDKEFLHKYPVIQYKRLGGRPVIYCPGEGIDQIHHFFSNKSWKINISQREIDLKIHKLDMNNVVMQVWNQFFHYQIRNWVALNDRNFNKYQNTKSNEDKKRMLEGILIGNIISMAKSIGWDVDKEVKVLIHRIDRESWVKVKGVKLMAFDVFFQTNVFLPRYVGLGKSSSLGYGVVTSVQKTTTEGSV